MKNQAGLYIHIPFCVSKCAYCDFLSFGGRSATEKEHYVEALIKELLALAPSVKESIRTIYIGGGTPSLLSVEQFEKIMAVIKYSYDIDQCVEFTIEMNPGTVTKDKLVSYQRNGVNRVSMGLQSDDHGMLKTLGRIHDFKDFLETYDLIVSSGITKISVDVMFGLPEQTMEDLENTLRKVIDLKPSHISAYSLIIEPDTMFEKLYDDGLLILPDEDLERDMFWKCHEILEASGYHHYEISNYALKNEEAIHNSSYWNLTPYYGLGLGASSYINHVRYKNTIDMADYLNGSSVLEKIRHIEASNSPKEDLEEALFLGLRKLDGINLESIKHTYGDKAFDIYGPIFDALVKDGLLQKEGPHIKLTHKGIDLSNQVFQQLILN